MSSEKNYPIVTQNMKRGMKVGISSVYVCGNLHRSFEVITQSLVTGRKQR